MRARNPWVTLHPFVSFMCHQMAQLNLESWHWGSLSYSPSQAKREIYAIYGSSTPDWADSVVLGQTQPVADVGLF